MQNKEQRARYYQKNKERIKSKSRKYYQKHRDERLAYNRRNRERHKETVRVYHKRKIDFLRKTVYKEYGNKCACCGEKEEMFLSLDHIESDGAEHRRVLRIRGGTALYQWVIKHKFPKFLRLLCFNCNCGRYRNGGKCPHELAKSSREL